MFIHHVISLEPHRWMKTRTRGKLGQPHLQFNQYLDHVVKTTERFVWRDVKWL